LTMTEGYVTADGDCRWICPKCVDDFKTRFAWAMLPGPSVHPSKTDVDRCAALLASGADEVAHVHQGRHRDVVLHARHHRARPPTRTRRSSSFRPSSMKLSQRPLTRPRIVGLVVAWFLLSFLVGLEFGIGALVLKITDWIVGRTETLPPVRHRQGILRQSSDASDPGRGSGLCFAC